MIGNELNYSQNCNLLPSANALSYKLLGATVFSKVDLKSAFNQLQVAKGDEWKTAIHISLDFMNTM